MDNQLKLVAKSYDRGVELRRRGINMYENLPDYITGDPDYPLFKQVELGIDGGQTGSGRGEIREYLAPAEGMKFVDLGCCMNLMFRGYDEWPSLYHGVDICAIMKIKKTTVGALALALVLVLGTVAVFAMSGPKNVKADDNEPAAVVAEAEEELTEEPAEADYRLVLELPEIEISTAPWEIEGSDFPEGLARYYSGWQASALVSAEGYEAYYLAEPIDFGEDGILKAAYFADYTLDLRGRLNYDYKTSNISVTNADGIVYNVGGYDETFFSFMNMNDKERGYVFDPTADITITIGDNEYPVRLERVPEGCQYGLDYSVNHYEEVTGGAR